MKNSLGLLLRLFLCLGALGLTLYLVVSNQNQLILLRKEIPSLEKEVHMLETTYGQLFFEYKKSTNPKELLRWLEEPQFGHLRYPKKEELIVLERSRDFLHTMEIDS